MSDKMYACSKVKKPNRWTLRYPWAIKFMLQFLSKTSTLFEPHFSIILSDAIFYFLPAVLFALRISFFHR